ncbi:hypothetical protein [Nibribacter koreensis]|uniref:Uncharacterized protein n=1 Tax=Nibribacter koreensis TaxID=1084519 RepID=A0ABP8FD90_9BACT
MKTALVTSLALLIAGVLTIYIINVFFNKKLSGLIKDKEYVNTSVSVTKGVLFLSSALILMEVNSSFQLLIKIWGTYFVDSELFMKEVLYFSVFLGIALLYLYVAFIFTTLMFGVITNKQKAFVEIANDNIYSAVLFSLLFLSFVLLAKSGINPLLDKLIPFPATPIYR